MSDQVKSIDIEALGSLAFSITDLAKLLKIRRNTLSERLQAQDAPFSSGPRGAKLYRIADAFTALMQQQAPTSQESDQLTSEMKQVKLELAKLELAKKQGQLVSLSEVLNTVSDQYQTIREQFVSLGQSLARDLARESDPLACSDLIDHRVNLILSFLSTEAFAENATLEDTAQAPDSLLGGSDVTE